ncbi:MAG: FAD-dependent oxidoreductase [Pirellulales bacterium]
MEVDSPTYDVAVLGSGFAGSLVALILAKAGRRVALIDRTAHPRFAVGESSTPAADYLLDQLCRQYDLEELKPLCRYGSWCQSFPEVRRGCKRGFSYIWHGSGQDYRATENHDCELMVAASPNDALADTQWYRPDVDQLFFQQALRHGVHSFVPVEATDILCTEHDGYKQPVWRLQLRIGRDSESIQAKFVVDASGPGSRFLSKLGVIDITDQLRTNTSAVYTHFSHVSSAHNWLANQAAKVDEFPFHFDKAAVHHLFQDGWLWQIGFDGDKTSVGFVTKQSVSESATEAHKFESDGEAAWRSSLDKHPVLKQFFENATLDEVPGRIIVSPRLQRLMTQGAGTNWAALPFTVGFIDPLHSTGIAHSLSGVLRICQALLANSEHDRKQLLTAYSQEVIREVRHIDAMISGCYDSLVNFKLFNCWTMIYFAAATTFERLHRQGESPSFLLVGDVEFSKIVGRCRDDLDALLNSENANDPERVQAYINRVRRWIQPYNHVKLFAPTFPNMYYHTVAEKNHY